ncbi:hypothetical protein [Dactylosporangium sp. NPDC049140]|uniref:hypothetical protein n=1 Tax=Dactylosporangium sp. NPDC049140 TaxID=3155647 RepID=UPI0033E20E15
MTAATVRARTASKASRPTGRIHRRRADAASSAAGSTAAIHTTGTPPAGALVFFNAAAINGYFGHVMLSEGNGNYITSGPTVQRVSLNWPGAPYIGWSYADPSGPGASTAPPVARSTPSKGQRCVSSVPCSFSRSPAR